MVSATGTCDTDVETEAAIAMDSLPALIPVLPICRLITFDASTVDVVVGCVESVVFVRQINADRAFVSNKRMFLVFRNIFLAVMSIHRARKIKENLLEKIVSAIVLWILNILAFKYI